MKQKCLQEAKQPNNIIAMSSAKRRTANGKRLQAKIYTYTIYTYVYKNGFNNNVTCSPCNYSSHGSSGCHLRMLLLLLLFLLLFVFIIAFDVVVVSVIFVTWSLLQCDKHTHKHMHIPSTPRFYKTYCNEVQHNMSIVVCLFNFTAFFLFFLFLFFLVCF